MKRALVMAWAVGLLVAPATAVPPERIADPRPGSAVVDLTGTLDPADVAAIDALATRARAGGEIVVVVIDSVDGAVPRQFTTRLFNRWRLDSSARNRGVLLLAALADRKAEIVLGDGYPAAATRVTDRIMREVVVARFRSDRPREAMVEGARALVEDLVLGAAVPSQASSGQRAVPAPAAEAPLQAPVASTYPLGLVTRATGFAADNALPLGAGLAGALVGGVATMRRHLRRRPRRCPECSSRMIRLDEEADDAHLSSGEKAEERVGSVDYDIWACPSCRHTLKLRYGTWFTSYARCPGCSARTLQSSTTTLRSATTTSEGLARVDEKCAHCDYTHSQTRTIPRVEESSSDSSSSSSSDSGGSSSGSGSSGSW